MENNILTAKEWLEKEEIFPKELNREQVVAKMVWQEIMERYADYRTKILEDKILAFRNLFKDINMIKRIDKHFNIKKEMQGKINE